MTGKTRLFDTVFRGLLLLCLTSMGSHNAQAIECNLLESLETLSEETLNMETPKPKHGQAMILLGFFKEGQKNGDLFFDIARKLETIFTKSDSEDLGFRFRRRVLTYFSFPEAFPVAGITNTIERVTKTIDHAVETSNGKRNIWVNLDGFEASSAFRRRGTQVETLGGVFNAELAHLLVPGKIDKVRWLLGGREIPPEVAKEIFSPYFQELQF